MADGTVDDDGEPLSMGYATERAGADCAVGREAANHARTDQRRTPGVAESTPANGALLDGPSDSGFEFRVVRASSETPLPVAGVAQRILLDVSLGVIAVVLLAGVFDQFLARFHASEDARVFPRFGVRLGIVDGHFVGDVLRVGEGVPLDEM